MVSNLYHVGDFPLTHEGILSVTGETQRDAERHGEAQGGTDRLRERDAEAWGQADAEAALGTFADVDFFLSSRPAISFDLLIYVVQKQSHMLPAEREAQQKFS